MQSPLQIAFEHIPQSDAVEARVREEAAKLEQFCDRITAMRVVVARPQHRHTKGDTFQVRIHITVPGAADIAISREPAATGAHEDVYVAIRDAFDAITRRLEDHARKVRGDQKLHEAPDHGRVARLFPDYGFIETADGSEVYFHRNAVPNHGFDRLGVGAKVRVVIAEGESAQGPQASTVIPIGKHNPT